MHYRVQHHTSYLYEDKVSYSHHLAHLSPIDDPGQTCLSHQLKIKPEPETRSDYTDYYGNRSTYFSISSPHEKLVVESTSEVEVLASPAPQLDFSPAWETVRAQLLSSTLPLDLAAIEFAFPSKLCPVSQKLADYALPSFAKNTPILRGVRDLTERIFRDFKFDNTATTVSTPVHEVLEKRAGVCQDFAHLQIACLRSIGLPAKYLSGYLRTDPPPGKPRLVGADASHAWIATYVPQLGWTAFDATNNVIPSLSHIRIAQGRDYHDVSPLLGTVFGGGAQRLKIGVTVTPMDEKPAPAPALAGAKD